MLDRKDFRGRLDPAWHDLMHDVAHAEGLDDGKWIEALILRELRQRVHAANVIAEAARRLGITGKPSGEAGRGRE